MQESYAEWEKSIYKWKLLYDSNDIKLMEYHNHRDEEQISHFQELEWGEEGEG